MELIKKILVVGIILILVIDIVFIACCMILKNLDKDEED